MSEIKDLKKEHKKLEAITKRATKKRLNDRTSDSWMNLRELKKLKGRKIIYTNANRQHANDVLIRLELTNVFDEIFDIKTANYIPKPEASPYEQIISEFNIDPITTIMFDDIAKNLVPAKNVGFASVWIDVGYENFSDDIAKSKKYLDYETKDLSFFLDRVNTGKI